MSDFEAFPGDAQVRVLAVLTIAAEGGKADIAKPLHGFGLGVFEIALGFRGDAFRVVYALQIADERKNRSRERPPEMAEGGSPMKSETLELVRGSGNAFRDVGRDNADLEQLKALLAAEIIKALDRDELSVRAAHAKTGFAAADFSRIRNADLGRFTADRLVSILNKLGTRVEVKIRVHRRAGSTAALSGALRVNHR